MSSSTVESAGETEVNTGTITIGSDYVEFKVTAKVGDGSLNQPPSIKDGKLFHFIHSYSSHFGLYITEKESIDGLRYILGFKDKTTVNIGGDQCVLAGSSATISESAPIVPPEVEADDAYNPSSASG